MGTKRTILTSIATVRYDMRMKFRYFFSVLPVLKKKLLFFCFLQACGIYSVSVGIENSRLAVSLLPRHTHTRDMPISSLAAFTGPYLCDRYRYERNREEKGEK